ncbi:Peptidylprolyl_isomerase [Hexamita inflata]|uniref:peptidylprolyl isomerase n=1 Tax=Hexamita inflata TaxID=28002 RepID=A0AA86QTJ8_9EUKA|nr:Peptidylprolyl isomerase [Hexamita inflata]
MSIREADLQRFNELCTNPEYTHVVQNQLLKKVITPGDGEKCPDWNATVKVHYHGTMLDGSVFDSSVRRNEPFEFHVGQGAVIKGWDKGVPTMQVNEKSYFVIHPDMAYGPSGSGSIPAKAVICFEVTLLDFVEDDHEYPTTAEEKLQAAKIRQEAGKVLFGEQKFTRANAKYEKGTQLLESIVTDSNELKVECFRLRATLFANMCLCFQKLNQFALSVKNGKEALKILVDNSVVDDDLRVKIYSRIIKSLVQMKKIEEAIKIGNEGVESVKDGSLISKELAKAKQIQAEEEAKRKQMYAKMMKPSFLGGNGGSDAGAKTGDQKDI